MTAADQFRGTRLVASMQESLSVLNSVAGQAEELDTAQLHAGCIQWGKMPYYAQLNQLI